MRLRRNPPRARGRGGTSLESIKDRGLLRDANGDVLGFVVEASGSTYSGGKPLYYSVVHPDLGVRFAVGEDVGLLGRVSYAEPDCQGLPYVSGIALDPTGTLLIQDFDAGPVSIHWGEDCEYFVSLGIIPAGPTLLSYWEHGTCTAQEVTSNCSSTESAPGLVVSEAPFQVPIALPLQW
ncbi:MAG: hypothetical protein AMXMBFR64_62020 [Myxococcales bacterium]